MIYLDKPLVLCQQTVTHACTACVTLDVLDLEGAPDSGHIHRSQTTVFISCTHHDRSMGSTTLDLSLPAYVPSSQGGYGSYAPSVTSSVASSQLSVFSDTGSAQSSIASSYSDDFRLSQEEASQACAPAYLEQQTKAGHAIAAEHQRLQCTLKAQYVQPAPSYADVTSVPSEQRQHPRRSSVARKSKPPPLVRQFERKVAFVDNLVGKHIPLLSP